MPIRTKSQRVTIGTVGTAGTASFRLNGLITNIYVEPNGTAALGACNAGVYDAWLHAREIVASTALGTASLTALWAYDVNRGFVISDERDLEVRFNSGTGNDEWVAHIDYLDSWS